MLEQASVAPPPPQRIEVDRTRRKVLVSVSASAARFRVGAALIPADIAVLTGAFALRSVHGLSPLGQAEAWATVAVPVLLTTYVLGGYRLDAVQRTMPLKVMALGAGCASFVALVLYKMLFQEDELKPTQVMVWSSIGLLAAPAYGLWVGLSRWPIRALLARRESRAALLHIGSYASALRLHGALRQCGHRTPLVIFTDERPPNDDHEDGPTLARLEELDGCLSGAIKAIILSGAPQDLPPSVLKDLVHARLLNIPIRPPSLLFEELWERTPVAMDDPSWLLQDERLHPTRSMAYQGSKRIVDVVVAVVGLVLAAPVMAAVALAIRFSSAGPVLYSQVRVGLWKRPFTIYKFRSMRTDAESISGAQWAQKADPRVTRLGRFLRKTRLDELPQLWNVLVGDMSLVGPRPERPEFTDRLEAIVPYYDIRHLVKPGLTGWAQVRYPYGASVDDALAKLEYEIYYIKSASLRFDLRILMRTIGTIVGLHGR